MVGLGWGGFGAGGVDGDNTRWDIAIARLGKQLLNDAFGLVVLAFTELMMTNLSLRIDEIMRRPIFVIECPPDLVVVVDRNRISDSERRNGFFHIVEILLEREF